jgi:hypothetical protein
MIFQVLLHLRSFLHDSQTTVAQQCLKLRFQSLRSGVIVDRTVPQQRYRLASIVAQFISKTGDETFGQTDGWT